MKIVKNILPILIVALLFPTLLNAQERVVIPLTNPGEPGSLNMEVIHGSVTVSGYSGDEVIIRYSGEQMKKEEPEVTEDGLRRISNNSIGLEVTEENNHVDIEGSPWEGINNFMNGSSVSYAISVPNNFSISLGSVNGSLTVKNVSGELELETVNGKIILSNITGSALVNTVNGEITATFDEVNQDNPMAFTNLNGDIDVTIPANASFTAKIKSNWGEVYTDFEMDIRNKDDTRSTTDDGVYQVNVNEWIYGTVNGGGPEYLFKSLRGEIYIRKK